MAGEDDYLRERQERIQEAAQQRQYERETAETQRERNERWEQEQKRDKEYDERHQRDNSESKSDPPSREDKDIYVDPKELPLMLSSADSLKRLDDTRIGIDRFNKTDRYHQNVKKVFKWWKYAAGYGACATIALNVTMRHGGIQGSSAFIHGFNTALNWTRMAVDCTELSLIYALPLVLVTMSTTWIMRHRAIVNSVKKRAVRMGVDAMMNKFKGIREGIINEGLEMSYIQGERESTYYYDEKNGKKKIVSVDKLPLYAKLAAIYPSRKLETVTDWIAGLKDPDAGVGERSAKMLTDNNSQQATDALEAAMREDTRMMVRHAAFSALKGTERGRCAIERAKASKLTMPDWK